MCCLQWDRVIVGAGQPPAYALSILLAAVTLNGALDGMAVGAVFGEMAILGPSSAHVSGFCAAECI
jgi:hypothetical protein